jgi:hypothetical protein
MSSTIRWSSLAAPVAVLGAELNDLFPDAYSPPSAPVDNGADRHLYGDFELTVSFDWPPAAGGSLGLYLVASLDGSNYADGGDGVAPPPSAWRGAFLLRSVPGAQRVHIHGVVLPPAPFRCVIQNATDQVVPAGAATVRLYRYHEEIA